MPVDAQARRFVTALARGNLARLDDGGRYVIMAAGRRISLDMASVRELEAAGIVGLAGGECAARPEARTWLRRALDNRGEQPFVSQHRQEAMRADGVRVNLDESPLGRLARPGHGGPAFLAPHQVEAGERIRRLAERASLQPRLTMSYSAAHVAGGGGGGAGAEIGDMAATARRDLTRLLASLPGDCAGVVLDVCCWLKGLQAVEAERGWPRRSAKLVLRIGLEQAARHFGLEQAAMGPSSGPDRVWRPDDARPTGFG